MKTIEAAIPEVRDFKWVYIMDHWDVHLRGICRVSGEMLFFRLESDQYSDGPLEYGIYRFPPEETAYFIRRKAEFEDQVGTHWTYSEDGKTRGPQYTPNHNMAGKNGVPKFYSLPKVYSFDEVCVRSECVGRYISAECE